MKNGEIHPVTSGLGFLKLGDFQEMVIMPSWLMSRRAYTGPETMGGPMDHVLPLNLEIKVCQGLDNILSYNDSTSFHEFSIREAYTL